MSSRNSLTRMGSKAAGLVGMNVVRVVGSEVGGGS